MCSFMSSDFLLAVQVKVMKTGLLTLTEKSWRGVDCHTQCADVMNHTKVVIAPSCGCIDFLPHYKYMQFNWTGDIN